MYNVHESFCFLVVAYLPAETEAHQGCVVEDASSAQGPTVTLSSGDFAAVALDVHVRNRRERDQVS